MSEHQPRSDQSGWTFANSFLFAITVVTTIGYGHLTISTTAGKVFTVLYSIVGIPIFVITSQQVGLHLCTLSKKLYKRIEKRPCLKRRRRLMALLTNLSLGFTIFMLAPASIFCAVEGWAYADSLYFVFISLTTIGFGDFYPTFSKDHDTAAYRIFVSVWIVLGLVWMATAAAATIDTVKKWAKRWRRRSRRGSTRQQRNLDSDDTSSSEDEF
ncbi:potassium channel subfamily K member 16-like [Watersipora subatra]|uniref:potassium channel subfamily K member 16-like n=1 Tax=Watersipora subatra TaxID=2589382 RepID=UPI00355C4A5C